MVDLLAKQTSVLSAATAAYNTAVGAAHAAAAIFDGHTTPMAAFLNVGFETNTQIDADGILKVTGTIEILWINLGDF